MITRAARLPAIAFDLQGHRGARGLAPENTIASFSTALAIGVTTLELDVGMTRDGVVVVHHDERLNPDITRGADGAFLSQRGPPIYSLTLQELDDSGEATGALASLAVRIGKTRLIDNFMLT